jgi:CheY-like chemotaxis protein
VLNGVEAVKSIRALEARTRRQPAPIVAFSANVMQSQVAEYTKAGFSAQLAKPIQLEELLSCLEQTAAAPRARAARSVAALDYAAAGGD